MTVSAVLFDFGGTLDSNGIPWLDRFYPLYRRQGLDVSLEEFSRAFYASDDHLAARFRLADVGLEETLRLQVRGVLEVLAPGRLDLIERIVQPFLYDSRDSFRRARRVLERLHEKYSLGIVSNFYGNLDSILAGEGLASFFGVISDSGKLGFLKPAPEIFLHAMNQLGAGPGRTWMVGDSVARDMKGAEMIGLSHAWLKGDRQEETPVCCRQAVVLNSLDELEVCLESSSLV